jgi:hypothetical protein
MPRVRSGSCKLLPVVVMGLLVACGGAGDTGGPAEGTAPGTGSAAATTSVDACDLLTAAEIGDALGAELGSPRHGPGSMPGGPITICQWPRAGQDLPFFQLSLTPNAASSYDEWMAGMARDLGEPLDPATNRRVDGIGDWAVWVADTRSLLVASGRRLLHVMVDAGSSEQEATGLARLALQRLG